MSSSFATIAPPRSEAGTLWLHMRKTVVLAAPIALSLLAEMAMGLISTMMLGSLGANALAAGGLASNLFFTVLIVMQAMLSGVGVLAAGALGAGKPGSVPGIYWSGVLLGCCLAVPLLLLFSVPSALLRLMHVSGSLIPDISAYLRMLRWGVPGGIVGVGMMRQFLPAVGLQRMLLWVMPCGVVLHALFNQVLIYGAFGIKGFGLVGSAAATSLTLTVLAAGLLGLLHGSRHFHHFVVAAMPTRAVLRPLFAIGLPVGGTIAVEAGFFAATGVVAGTLGPAILASHMIALSATSVLFMVPLSLSQAANVRVATAMGAGNPPAARLAGFSAILLGVAFMGASALLFRLAPGLIVAAYLGPVTIGNQATATLAPKLLRVAGVFQIADGTQVTAAGALRGLRDTRLPMILAALGYWGVGFWAGRYLAFDVGLGAVGLWWGLCAGLAAVAFCLTARFAWLS
jgi:MATE family multidrug resistance protein